MLGDLGEFRLIAPKRRDPVARKNRRGEMLVLLLLVAPQLAGAALSSMAPKPSTRGGLRILEWIPSQQLLVRTARFGWNTAWR